MCDIEIGYRSTAMSLLGMLSLKLGRSVAWDGENNTIPGDDRSLPVIASRPYRGPWQYPETGKCVVLVLRQWDRVVPDMRHSCSSLPVSGDRFAVVKSRKQ